MRRVYPKDERRSHLGGRRFVLEAPDEVVAIAKGDAVLKLVVHGGGSLGYIRVAVIHVIPGNPPLHARLLGDLVLPASHQVPTEGTFLSVHDTGKRIAGCRAGHIV